MKTFLTLFASLMLATGFLGAGPSSSQAGMNPDAKLALDLQARSAKRHCAPTYPSLDAVQGTYDGSGYIDAIVVLYDYVGVTGVQYGLDFSSLAGWYFTGFVTCSDLDFQEQDSGTLYVEQVWASCQRVDDLPDGDTVLGLGWLMVYGGEGEIRIVPSRMGANMTSDCFFDTDVIQSAESGFVGGYMANESTTWGKVKALYR